MLKLTLADCSKQMRQVIVNSHDHWPNAADSIGPFVLLGRAAAETALEKRTERLRLKHLNSSLCAFKIKCLKGLNLWRFSADYALT